MTDTSQRTLTGEAAPGAPVCEHHGDFCQQPAAFRVHVESERCGWTTTQVRA